MGKFITENWFKIALAIIAIFVLRLWQQSIQNTRVYNFTNCVKGNDLSQYSLCVSFYPDLAGIK